MKNPGGKNPSAPRTRILIYGAGAIGCTFGGKLLASGCDVTLLARGAWHDQLKQQGLILENCLTHQQQLFRPRIINELRADDIYDYILVVMQNSQVESILPVLSANRSANLVFVVNTPQGYGRWQEAIGTGRLMIGFPSAGGERAGGKVNYFIGTGLIKAFQSTTFGEPDGRTTPRLRRLVAIFRRAGFAPARNSNMSAWQKCHVAVILAIGRALYRFDSDNYRLARSPDTIRRMILATREGFAVLRGLGVAVTPGKLNFYYAPLFILTPIFQLVLNTRMAEFAMAKHTIAAREEMEVLERQFRDLGMAKAMPTPFLDGL